MNKYLEKVLGSKVKVKVFRAMLKFPDKKFTVRELAKFISVSHPPILRSLHELEGMNLISVERHGQSNLLTFNKNSYLYNILKKLFRAEEKTKQELISIIKSNLPKVEMVVLFGSIQKGNERMRSDIDLLIVTGDKKLIKKTIEAINFKLSKIFGNTISAIILTKKEFKTKKNKPFAKTLITSYSVIKGKDLIKEHWLA